MRKKYLAFPFFLRKQTYSMGGASKASSLPSGAEATLRRLESPREGGWWVIQDGHVEVYSITPSGWTATDSISLLLW